jgi:hypothetical protein
MLQTYIVITVVASLGLLGFAALTGFMRGVTITAARRDQGSAPGDRG